jgi:DMSO/TMAO reductase YedYZ molybdopterin-dependent catalytic subunit
MGNARWAAVCLKDLLDRAGVAAGATAVRFTGAGKLVVEDRPRIMKSLSVDHARDTEGTIAWAMNGASPPLLDGFPIRLVVPGWYATYWTKALVDIEVLSGPDENFWMKTAYTIPDTPGANMRPRGNGRLDSADQQYASTLRRHERPERYEGQSRNAAGPARYRIWRRLSRVKGRGVVRWRHNLGRSQIGYGRGA